MRVCRTDDSPETVRGYLRLDGKRVAIVGNAESLFTHSHGELIDSHAAVIRLNRGFIRAPAQQGKRTDIVALSSLMAIDELRAGHGHCKTIWMTPRRAALTDAFIAESGLVFYPRALWRALSRELGGARPSTGLMTIDLAARRCNPASVSVFGFDFKRTKTFYDDRNYFSVHNWCREQEWVDTLIKRGRAVLYA